MSKRILVVEDQADNRQIIRDMLAPTDYEISEAENGEEALASIAPIGACTAEFSPVVGALTYAASTCRSTITGSVKAKVEPWPGRVSTQIRPPCISMMRLDMASPKPVPPFFLVIVLSAC